MSKLSLQKIDAIFWHKLTSPNETSTLKQNSQVLKHLKTAISLSTIHDFKAIVVPIFLFSDFETQQPLHQVLDRAESVMKYVKGFLSEAAVETRALEKKFNSSGLSVHFVIPSSISDDTCQRLRNRFLEVFRTSLQKMF